MTLLDDLISQTLDTLRVLLVEDNPGDALLLRETLADVPAPGPALEWTHVWLLEEALEQLRRRSFDVVLLDLSLPDSHGLGTFDRITRHAPDTPVVMMTGLNDEELALEAMQRGAQDYLVKGSTDGLGLMRSLRYAVERSRRWEAERTVRSQQEEFEVARAIQQQLFPTEAPRLPGYDIAGRSYPAIATGGDYFDFIPMVDAGCMAVVIGDVCGHGLGPALVMVETRAYLRALMLTRSDVGEILELANRALARDTADNRFVTLMLARLDLRRRELVYSSAGHGMGYIMGGDGTVKAEMSSTGIPLGIMPDQAFPVAPPLTLEAGDLVLLMTDGVIEAKCADGTQFGIERALQIVRQNLSRPATEIVEMLCDAARHAHGSEGDHADDITSVVIRVLSR